MLGIRLPDGEITLNPNPQRVLRPGEVLICIGPPEAIVGSRPCPTCDSRSGRQQRPDEGEQQVEVEGGQQADRRQR